jgi:hypothetical protein
MQITCTVVGGFYKMECLGIKGEGWSKELAYKDFRRNIEHTLELIRGLKSVDIGNIVIEG